MDEPPYREDVDLEKLLRIAEATAFECVSPSARSNLTDQIASDAVEQYLRAIEAGDQIQNPYGWIKVVARRRALDAIDVWDRRKKATIAIDEGKPRVEDYYVQTLRTAVLQGIDSGTVGDPEAAVVEREWVAALIQKVFPDDEENRAIAMACIVEGAKPREVADDFSMTPKVLGNRLVRIRNKLREVLGDLPESQGW